MDYNYNSNNYENKSICSKCGQVVDEILMLSCDHNLCLSCAAKNLYREENKGIHKYHTVVCDVCGAGTKIDPSTTQELLSENENISKTEKSVHDFHSKKNTNESILNMSYGSKAVNTGIYPLNPYQRREICKEHNEEVSYYCFDCLSKCICSECVVHGIHKNHDVLHIKKAYPVVSEKVNNLQNLVREKVDDVSQIQNSLDLKKKDIIDSTNQVKQQMSNVFDEIRQKLNKKEKELMEKADAFLTEHLQEINTYTRIVQSNIISLNKMIDTINSNLLRKDEVNLLNFYSENVTKITSLNSAGIPDIPDLQNIFNLKVNIKRESIDNLISSLNAIEVEIYNIKGFEPQPINNQIKFSVKRDLYGVKPSNSNSLNHSFQNNNSTSNIPLYNYQIGNQNPNYETKNILNNSFKNEESRRTNSNFK